MPKSEHLLTTGEAAKQLGVSTASVQRWIKAGQLPAVRLPSGRFRVRTTDVDVLLAPSELAPVTTGAA